MNGGNKRVRGHKPFTFTECGKFDGMASRCQNRADL
jgi:hypothetical protein